jgi:hypothetical protein
MHSRLIEQLEDEREREMGLRSSLRKDEWDALKRERDAERSEKDKARTQAAGGSFFSRRRIWKEEKKSLAEIHKAKTSEISDLRRKEHLCEEELGSKEASSDSEDNKPE